MSTVLEKADTTMGVESDSTTNPKKVHAGKRKKQMQTL